MCGIAGIVAPPGRRPSRALLEGITDTLRRRGPDDRGIYLDAACGLGHRRLSIIDLAGGHQPLSNTDGTIQTVVNGEIYNFMALREELEAKGHEFRTRSDCEVVAHGWEEWGRELFARLDGMFALAIWDARTRTLALARDRMGKKPLYYAFMGPARDWLVFASELKALAAHPGLERKVDPAALASYLTYECVPEGAALYAGVEKLLPGTAMIYEREKRRSESFPFWTLSFRAAPSVPDLSRWDEDRIADELRGRILEATRARLVSDVPLGVFLSGGIDSSTITAAMAQLVPGKEIKTFSIAFDDPSFDESAHARRVAEHLGTDHHEETLSPEVMLDILPEVADFMCEPIGDASVIPTYLLSRFTRRTVTVALGGDGGDELFLGYPTFQAESVAQRLDRALSPAQEGAIGRAAGRLARLLPVSHANFSLDFKIKRFAQGLGFPSDLRHQAWMGSFLPDELAGLFTARFGAGALARHPYATIAAFRDRTDARDEWDALMYQYWRLYLNGCVLVKVDRASMAVGLEVRAPLLDTKVVELAAAIPGRLKLHGMVTKYILKRAARAWLPNEIIDRPKKGFGIPVGAWLRGPLKALAYEHLGSNKVREAGYFDPAALVRMLREHDEGKVDHRKPLWTLLAFHLWHERFGPGGRFPTVGAPLEAEPGDDSSVVLRC